MLMDRHEKGGAQQIQHEGRTKPRPDPSRVQDEGSHVGGGTDSIPTLDEGRAIAQVSQPRSPKLCSTLPLTPEDATRRGLPRGRSTPLARPRCAAWPVVPAAGTPAKPRAAAGRR